MGLPAPFLDPRPRAPMHTCKALTAFAIQGAAVTRELQRKAFQSKRPSYFCLLFTLELSTDDFGLAFFNYECPSRVYALIMVPPSIKYRRNVVIFGEIKASCEFILSL